MKKAIIAGIPSHAGALLEGTELSPAALRAARLSEKLLLAGFEVEDLGDVLNVHDLARHNIAPIRNWPAPRIVWEKLVNESKTLFHQDKMTFLLGGDCSIEVGSFTAFREIYGESSHLLVLDAHMDTIEPNGDQCMGSAGMGLWFLTQDQQKWWKNEQPFPTSFVSVIGAQIEPENSSGIKVLTYQTCKENPQLIKEHLQSIKEQHILVHFDVDIMNKEIMPAAYSPSEHGFDKTEISQILKTIFMDERVKAIEVTEFSPNKDVDGKCANLITDLLALAGNETSC